MTLRMPKPLVVTHKWSRLGGTRGSRKVETAWCLGDGERRGAYIVWSSCDTDFAALQRWLRRAERWISDGKR